MRRISMVTAVAGGVLVSTLIVGAVVVSAGAQPADRTAATSETPAVPSARADLEVDSRHAPVVLEPPKAVVAPVDSAPAAEPMADTAPVEPLQELEVSPEPDVEPEASADDWYPTAEEQAKWLAFQQVVRECMAQAGQEYLHGEWWNGSYQPMPNHLDADGRAAWELALHGDTPLGAEYDWRRAGCWGYAAELAGNTH